MIDAKQEQNKRNIDNATVTSVTSRADYSFDLSAMLAKRYALHGNLPSSTIINFKKTPYFANDTKKVK